MFLERQKHMDWEYRSLKKQGFDANILFFGQENCLPNYYFKGNNVRDCYIIHYVQSGKGILSVANHHTVNLKAGDMFILPKNVACFYKADSKKPWSYFWIGFSGARIKELLQNSKLLNKFYLRQIQESKSYQSFKALFDSAHHPSSLAAEVLIEANIYRFFYDLITEFPENGKKNKQDADHQLHLAISYLNNNFTNPDCSVTSICNAMDISRSHLYTLFKNNFDTSPRDFIIKLRIDKAKEYLTNTNSTIQQISTNIGYTDEFTFSKAFKRQVGLSPSNYRKNPIDKN